MDDRREHMEQPEQRRARQDRIEASITTLKNAGLTVEKIDEQTSLVASRFEWHHTTNHWKEQGGARRQGYELLALITAAKEPGPTRSPQSPAPAR
ncbi:MAG: hypothetical protein E6G97_02055 [Alphaproteobacteria bacterium]|nr:MAG: hypothetical protein E6G97_02055 [Alphaproteobacteria bacterium]